MKPLASFIMESRTRAVTATVAFGVGGLALPPLAVVSSAAVALVALRAGLNHAAVVAAISAVVLGMLAWAMGMEPLVGVGTGLVQWLPAMVLAEVLRRTVSWPNMLLTATGIACGVILLVRAAVADVAQMWVTVLQAILGPLLQQTGMSPAEVEQALRQVAPVMTGLLAAAMVLTLVLALILARYWQSVLYNPGGFAEEFQRLQLGKVPAVLLAVSLGGAWLGQSDLLMELSMVFLVVFFIQGVALVHALTRQLDMNRFWLVGMYVLLVIAMPQMMTMLAAFGVLDSAFDFRTRLGKRPGSGGEGE
ncbi:hypothetical protein B1C78_06915 [Thioalkalivibrio denitrificans]|uniref:DUF2232 domain-containing protein n=1 Tax=Thioalkalivibrio denitrificans TaxID=108003 RepID=A0A1V3NJU2_9GAMM|nr:DUF2232 domain-containing protein [Thioalkalivibrio denitrificans]OOG25379.1 hypothetical protein B1C78_06915 [Thioalkalivibrio denitrificans]